MRLLFQHFPKTTHKSPESLKALIPKLQQKVFNTPEDVFHPENEDPTVVEPAAEEQNRSVSLSQDELDGVQALLREDEQEEMMRALQESKRSGFLEEEERRAAWQALGQQVPGTSGMSGKADKGKLAKKKPEEPPQMEANKDAPGEEQGGESEEKAAKKVHFKADSVKKDR